MIIEEIRAALLAKASALVRRSAADMTALMHPDFVHVTAGGRTLTRADYIDVFINSDKVVYHSQHVRDLEVRCSKPSLRRTWVWTTAPRSMAGRSPRPFWRSPSTPGRTAAG